MRKYWISNTIFDWPHHRGSWSVASRSSVTRAYEYWAHAERLLEGSPSSFTIGDAVANLKRSLNHRLKLIERLYHLRTIGLAHERAGYLEILESVGLVRPALLRHLLEVRNAIEHKDARPPSVRRCAELVDVVWYFLRSTDDIVRNVVSDISFEHTTANGEETQYGFTLDMKFGRSPCFKVSGWFPRDVIFKDDSSQATQMSVATIHNNAKLKIRGAHLDKLDSDLWVIARLHPRPSAVQKIVGVVFDFLS